MINRGLPSTCVLSKFPLYWICSSTDFYSIFPANVPTKKLKPEGFSLLLAQWFKLKPQKNILGVIETERSYGEQRLCHDACSWELTDNLKPGLFQFWLLDFVNWYVSHYNILKWNFVLKHHHKNGFFLPLTVLSKRVASYPVVTPSLLLGNTGCYSSSLGKGRN